MAEPFAEQIMRKIGATDFQDRLAGLESCFALMEHLDELTRGKDSDKVRIVLE